MRKPYWTGNSRPLQTVAPKYRYTSESLDLLCKNTDFLSWCWPTHLKSFQVKLIFMISWATCKPLNVKGPSHLPLRHLSIPTHPSRLCSDPTSCRRTFQIPESHLITLLAFSDLVKNGFRKEVSCGLRSWMMVRVLTSRENERAFPYKSKGISKGYRDLKVQWLFCIEWINSWNRRNVI